jgi:glycerol uptake facilitator-like aquaporin
MFSRPKVAALVAEFLGTYLLVSVVLSMATRTQFSFFPAVVAGALLAGVVLTFGHVSSAHLNPAVTLGLWTLRKIQTSQALVYIVVQLLAGFTALRVTQQLLNTPLSYVGGNNVDWRIITAEFLGALVLGLGVAAVLYRGYEGAKLAATLGLSLAIGIVVASLGGNGLINPAVAVGLNSLSVSYVVGAIVGVVGGMNLYALLFAPLDRALAKKKR